jgi:hypothetical protein
MDKTPFSLYDFFGYLAPSILLVVSLDYFIYSQKMLAYAAQNVVTGVISLLLLYIIGQLIATPAALLLETLLVKKYLKEPKETLLKINPLVKGFKKIFSSYFKPLSPRVRINILKAFSLPENEELQTEKADEIYQLAFSKVKKDEKAIQRLYIFLNLYGFARNICFTSFLIAIILLINSLQTGTWYNNYWMLCYIIIGIIMLFRFLKFYRHYAYDLYLSFISS